MQIIMTRTVGDTTDIDTALTIIGEAITNGLIDSPVVFEFDSDDHHVEVTAMSHHWRNLPETTKYAPIDTPVENTNGSNTDLFAAVENALDREGFTPQVDRVFTCPECGENFTRAASLGAHRARKHNFRSAKRRT